MDSDFWTTRLAAAKRQLNMQSSNHLGQSHLNSQLDELDVEDEIRSDYPCPYCYLEFDIGLLCSHLEDEHSCESKPTLCPVCSIRVTGDLLSHIMLQHGNLMKLQRHRRLRRVPVPNSQALSLLGRDLREAHLQLLLGGSRSNSSASSTAVTDNLFSSLLSSLTASETDEISKSLMSSLEENSSKSVKSEHMWKAREAATALTLEFYYSFLSTLSNEEREQRIRQATGIANFVQDLLISTLLLD